MNVRSLRNLERRMKFANAIGTSNYDIICLCETWLNENIASSELMLNEYSIYRSERQTAKDQNLHGGVLMAVKQTFSSKLLPNKQPECCLTCSIQINDKRIIVWCFYNPPSSSKYRHCLGDFAQILNEIEKSNQSTATLICGDVNFPNANWIDYSSTENEENSIIELIEQHQFEQAIDFPTCGKNALDITLFKNCHIHATPDENFSKIYNCSDHKAISILIECPHHEVKVAIENFRSFGSVDYNEIKKSILNEPFSPVCHTNINRMCEELYDYLENLVNQHVPRRTRRRQSLPPWVTPSTSNIMNKLRTQTIIYQLKPTSYRRNLNLSVDKMVEEAVEEDRINYQENLMSTRNTHLIFKHFKSLKKSETLPKTMIKDEIAVSKAKEKVNFLNEYFHSVFSPKSSFNLSDMKCENTILSNFSISKTYLNQIITELDVTKLRGPDGLPPIFFRRAAKEMTTILHCIFKNIKRLRKIPDKWKITAVSPIYKKSDKRLMKNYRPVSLFNIMSKLLKKCMHPALYDHFIKFLTRSQHGFVKKKPFSYYKHVIFLERNLRSILYHVIYTDFSKAFDKVPHYELLKKMSNIGVGCCFLGIIAD